MSYYSEKKRVQKNLKDTIKQEVLGKQGSLDINEYKLSIIGEYEVSCKVVDEVVNLFLRKYGSNLTRENGELRFIQ